VRDHQEFQRLVTATGRAQARLATEAGMTPQSLSQLLAGRRSRVTVETAVRIEQSLNIKRGTLFLLDGGPVLADYVDIHAA
jgi:transcriptional regulator with XRE-family HTH domain